MLGFPLLALVFKFYYTYFINLSTFLNRRLVVLLRFLSVYHRVCLYITYYYCIILPIILLKLVNKRQITSIFIVFF